MNDQKAEFVTTDKMVAFIGVTVSVVTIAMFIVFKFVP
jgi:hypothetical protein